MPDVGLFTATEPLSKDFRVVIKYSVEVESLPVYSETYNVDTLAEELAQDRERALRIWARRLECTVACRERPGFSASLTRCLTDGQACNCGHAECADVEQAG